MRCPMCDELVCEGVVKVVDSRPACGNRLISFLIHLPGRATGKITVPDDLDDDDVKMVEAAIAYIRLYAAKNSGKGKAPKEK